MFERFFETEFYKRAANDTMAGVHDERTARGLLKSIITALDIFFENSNAAIRVSWAGKSDQIESLLCYDAEDDRVLIVPVKVQRSLIELGGKLIYLAQSRCAAMLARAVLNEIETMQAGAA